jgi:serine/threonine protein phosphatase 1
MTSFFSSLFKPKAAKSASRIGRLTYAIGDIHGRDDLFAALIDRIKEDSAAMDEKPCLVLLGDYVDRGPSSKAVLERILNLQSAQWCDLVVLMGNHEEATLRFLSEPDYGQAWVEYGGATTLASYGVAAPRLRQDSEGWVQARDAFIKALGPNHLKLLMDMQISYWDEDYLFVHAGVKPGRPLEEQGAEVFLWIRGEFLAVDRACDYVVVHGHTPRNEPENLRWRIGVDTGAYATGRLTAVKLHLESRSMVFASV